MNKNDFLQNNVIDWLMNQSETPNMLPVYGKYDDLSTDAYLQCYLIPNERIDFELKSDACTHEDFFPGCTMFGSGEGAEVEYKRINNGSGIEPLVIPRSYHNIRPDSYDICEEFRLLFNLYQDTESNSYADLVDEKSVVEIRNKVVYIEKSYLKRYLAIKDMSLVLHIDSRLCDESNKYEPLSIQRDEKDKYVTYSLNIGNSAGIGCYSVLYGKKIIRGYKKENSGIWPYEKKEDYIDFIIGLKDDGTEDFHTCDPTRLSNDFGANPSAPHYLTPVYFKKEVLEKYYSDTKRYSVTSSELRCLDLWSLSIDNDKDSNIISAYLGDLGRDLPENERLYWKSFNIPLGDGLSIPKIARDFGGLFTHPSTVDRKFIEKYKEINALFIDTLGWYFFRPLQKDDEYNLTSLHVLSKESVKDMDDLALSISKVLIESINEDELKKLITEKSGKKGIDKLEQLFFEKSAKNYEDHIRFLRDLYALRSSGTGHKKGKNYEKNAAKFDIRYGNYIKASKAIFTHALEFLNYIGKNIVLFYPARNLEHTDCSEYIDEETLGKRLKILRLKHGFTQKQIAEKIGVDVTTYAHYESDRREPDLKKIKMLSDFYGMHNDILGLSLPIITKESIDNKLLDELKMAIKDAENNEKSDFLSLKKSYDTLNDRLNQVLDARNKSLFINVDEMSSVDLEAYNRPLTLKKVYLNPTTEALISNAMNMLNTIYNAMEKTFNPPANQIAGE